jgi:hypothetical protein
VRYCVVDDDLCDDDSYVNCDLLNVCGHVYLIMQLLLR